VSLEYVLAVPAARYGDFAEALRASAGSQPTDKPWVAETTWESTSKSSPPSYPSGQVTLNPEDRMRMLVSTNKCVDTWTLLKSEPKTLLQRPSVAGGGILQNSRRE
jgi:hypothetical protein